MSFDTTLYGPASMLVGIEQAAGEAGYFVSVANLKAITITESAVAAAIDRLTLQDVDGIVLIAPLQGIGDAVSALHADLPAVIVEGGSAPGVASVCVDQHQGARLVTRHLLDRGARTVWHIAGPANWIEADLRVAGWREELARAGAEIPEPLRGAWSPASGYEVGRKLAGQRLASRKGRTRRKDIDAVFVANDQMALGVLRAFHETGIRVPEDVMVAGFDDIPEAGYYTPPLTTVRQDFARVGRRSIELLLEQVDSVRSADRRCVIAPELVVRHSTAR